MSRPPPPRPTQAWTVFGRWRRPSPAARSIGVALLLLALLLTIWWAREPRGELDGVVDGATLVSTVS